jgi:site-specific DNA recombinase
MDECSRMARKLKDILGLTDILKHVGVKVILWLDSDDPNFSTLLTLYGMVAEQNSARLRDRVRRGQEGRVRQGLTSGSRCFGYGSEMAPDPAKPQAQSRTDMLGTRWVIVPSEAAAIVRIHEMYADGMSDHQICLKLNEEKVPAARKPRIGSQDTVWNCTLIKRILRNEKYIGKLTRNKTTQVIHPVTEKTETRKNPPEMWVHKEVPELRIVSDELWSRTQERLKIVNEKMTRRAGLWCLWLQHDHRLQPRRSSRRGLWMCRCALQARLHQQALDSRGSPRGSAC